MRGEAGILLSQRNRILGTLALAIVPLVVLAAVALWRELQDGEAQIAHDRIALARAATLATQSFVDGNLSTARTIAVAPPVVNADTGPATFLTRAAAANSDWEGVAVVDADGHTIAASQSDPPGFGIADRPYFQQVMATRRSVVSSGLTGRASGRPTIALAVPVDFASGDQGALIVPVPTDHLHAALRSQISTESLRVTVVDQEGQTIVHRDPERMLSLTVIRGRPDVDAALEGEIGSRVLSIDGISTLVAYAPVAQYGWAVLIAEPTAAAFAPARAALFQDVALFGLVLIVVGALGWLLAGRLSLFYERLIEARRQAVAAQEDLERALGTRDEFLASASHDLRNPLASIKAVAQHLGLQLDRGDVSPDRLRVGLASIDATTNRMARLIDGLLDVARLQLGRPLDLDLQSTDLGMLARQVADESQRTTNRHQIDVEVDGEVVGDWDGPRLQRVVSNLLDNAVKYSPGGGAVTVTISREDEPDATGLSESETPGSVFQPRICPVSSPASAAAATSWTTFRERASGWRTPARSSSGMAEPSRWRVC
jgi:two-component system, OmpR family, sensor kinase